LALSVFQLTVGIKRCEILSCW